MLSLEKMESSIKILEDKEYQDDKKNMVFNNLEQSAGPSIASWENPRKMNIKLKLDQYLTDYFKTKPFLTKGQKIGNIINGSWESDKNGNIFRYDNVIYTIELRSKILRYGSAI